MTFTVIVEPGARADLLRLYEHLLKRAEYLEDLALADRAMQAIDVAMAALASTPFLFRRDSGRSGLRRELVVPFGASGYVVKYEIATRNLVVVVAVRHQHETDHH